MMTILAVCGRISVGSLSSHYKCQTQQRSIYCVGTIWIYVLCSFAQFHRLLFHLATKFNQPWMYMHTTSHIRILLCHWTFLISLMHGFLPGGNGTLILKLACEKK